MAWEKRNVCAAPDCFEPCRRKWCSEGCRKRTLYGGTCKYCGSTTDGSNGAEKAPDVCRSCQGQDRKVWTREAILAALRLWIERFGSPPTVTDWSPAHARSLSEKTRLEKLERYKTGRWPAPTLVAAEFGSWQAMIQAGGLEPNQPMMPRGYWTRDRLVEAFRAWAAEHGRAPRSGDWTHATNGVHPSYKTVADVFGTWGAGIAAAGLSLPPRRRRRASSLPRRRPTAPPPPPIRTAPPAAPITEEKRKGRPAKELDDPVGLPTKEEPPANTPAANRARVASMRVA